MNGFIKHFDSSYVHFDKYNPMDINRGLCSLKK